MARYLQKYPCEKWVFALGEKKEVATTALAHAFLSAKSRRPSQGSGWKKNMRTQQFVWTPL
jgi:hypothetical protein